MIVSTLGFETPMPESDYEILDRFVPEERREKARKYFQRTDRERALLGEALVRYHLLSDFGIRKNEISFEQNSFGKPLLSGVELHFNISHSGRWVVCAIDTNDIGIDVEIVKDIDLAIAEVFFFRRIFGSHEETGFRAPRLFFRSVDAQGKLYQSRR